MRKPFLLLIVIALFALGGFAATWPHNPPPENFGFQLVYMADGIFDPSTGPSAAELSDWFHKDVMGRTDAEIEAERQNALEYFEAQFGLDLELADVMSFGQDPRTQYRAYKITGYNVPEEGWLVRDGGFMVNLAAGTTLYGEFGGADGVTLPGDGMIVYGEYNIDVTAPGIGNDPEDIIIHYQSESPIVPNGEFGTAFLCRVTSDHFEDFGGGLAQGVFRNHMTEDGRQVSNIRNVLTFPGLGFEAQELGLQ
ncbi:MAG: hypothetical protein RRC07_00445 [Anaerolineae bacterium]|nr:hypothetical protein [Anaerolineae bacterium]